MASKTTTPEVLTRLPTRAASRNKPRTVARAHNNRCGQRNGNCCKTKKPNMPDNGRYNRQALSHSRPLLAPTQAAPKKSTIAPTMYRRRRSSETARAIPNTRPVASRPTPSEPNLNFNLLLFADVDFIDCPSDRMRLGVCLDSRRGIGRPERLMSDSRSPPSFRAHPSLSLVRCRDSRQQ